MLTKGADTTVVAVAVLLDRFGSVCEASTLAVVLSVPVVVVLATIVSEALAPLASESILQNRVLLEIRIAPCVALVERTLRLAGKDSLTRRPVARLGPALVTDTR